MKTDYIPSKDAFFNIFQQIFMDYIIANRVRLGLTTDEVNAMLTLQVIWADAWAVAMNRNHRTHADVVAKDDAREVYEGAIRDFVASLLRFNTAVTDVDRANMGLTIPKHGRTPVSVPDSVPVVG